MAGGISGRCKLALASVAATALATTALAIPATALAEEAPKAPSTDDAKQATADAQQQAPTDSYKVTQSVEKDSKTFDTKEDAQKYLDDATQKATDMGKADTKSTYDIKTDGPTQVTKDTTHEETSVVDKGQQTFDNEADANKYVEDKTSGYEDTADTKYTTSGTVTQNETGSTVETTQNAHSGSQDGFATQEDAEQWVKDQTKGYKDTDDTTYTVHPSYQNNPTTEPDGDPVQVDSKTTTSQEFDSKADAEAAFQKDKEEDPSTDLHKVSFSDVQEKTTVVTPESTQKDTYQSDDYMTAKNRDEAMNFEIAQHEADGWTVVATTSDKDSSATIGRCFTKLNYSEPTYVIPANTYVIVKQATWYALWTPDKISEDVTKQIKDLINRGDHSTDGLTFHSGNYGFDSYFQNIGTQGAGNYWVHDNGNGTYTVHASCSKISHLDYGCIQYQPGSYSFTLDLTRKVPAVTKTTYHYTKTVTDYTQPTKTVDHWTASYSVDETTVMPVYEYVASYEVSQTKTVPDTGWKAGYEITKTTEYAPTPDNPTPDTPTPDTPTPTPDTPAPTPEIPAGNKVTETPKATPAVRKTTKAAAAAPKATQAKAQTKSALPKTGDSSTGAAGAAAIVAAALTAMGLGLRRKDQRN
ncbi:MAG: LPXTG cell wall anchor domain-containing protein [Atopobiaceae bacterium]